MVALIPPAWLTARSLEKTSGDDKVIDERGVSNDDRGIPKQNMLNAGLDKAPVDIISIGYVSRSCIDMIRHALSSPIVTLPHPTYEPWREAHP